MKAGDAAHAMSPTHAEAVTDGRSEADVLGVDAWLTEEWLTGTIGPGMLRSVP